jgi:hypothetical protein
MTIKSSRTSPLLTGNIKISEHGATESGEPFVRLDVGGKRVLVRVKAGASVPPGHLHASAPGYRGLYRGNQEIWLPYACFERLIASERRGKTRSFSVKRDIPGLDRPRVIALRVR